MSNNSGFDQFVDLTNREIALLFQRLNYFLIGSAFLVTAFATLVATAGSNLPTLQLNLAYMINLAGFYLSLFFAFINYLNTKIIWYKDEMIRKLEKKSNGDKQAFHAFTRSRKIVIDMYKKNKLGNNHLVIFFKMIEESINFVWNTRRTSQKGLAPHTYLIPLGFWVLWITLYFLILSPICWIYTLFFFLPFACWALVFLFKLPSQG